MSEQTVNTCIRPVLRSAAKRCGILIIALISFVLSGCMPTGEENINTELFKNKEDLKSRAASLKPGITREKVFEALGIPSDKFERMSLAEVQASIYGNSQVQGTPEQLESFKQRLMNYEGYALPYKVIKSDGSLGFGKMKVHKSGQDMRIVVIFDHGHLLRAAVEGNENVSEENDRYIWDGLISKGIGLAF
jgi:hypothetical protein